MKKIHASQSENLQQSYSYQNGVKPKDWYIEYTYIYIDIESAEIKPHIYANWF